MAVDMAVTGEVLCVLMATRDGLSIIPIRTGKND